MLYIKPAYSILTDQQIHVAQVRKTKAPAKTPTKKPTKTQVNKKKPGLNLVPNTPPQTPASPQTPVSQQSIITRVQQAISAFSKAFNAHIRVYNPSIKTVQKALVDISKNPNWQYTPQITSKLEQLAQFLETTVQDTIGNISALQQISQLAQELASLVGSSPSQSQSSPSSQSVNKTTPSRSNQIGNWLGRTINAPVRSLRDIGRGFMSGLANY